MNQILDVRPYGYGTSTSVQMPFSFYCWAKAMCSDGVVRKTIRISSTADTFFSVPASVRVKGKAVSGYITIETASGSSVATDDDPAVVKFVAYTYGKNGHLLPPVCRECGEVLCKSLTDDYYVAKSDFHSACSGDVYKRHYPRFAWERDTESD